MRTVFSLLLLLAAFNKLQAQDSLVAVSDVPAKEFKNTIRFNLSNPIIVSGKSIIFGYERVLSEHRSFSVNIGQTGLPRLNILRSDSVESRSTVSNKGYNFSVDYRFYLPRQNKYNAPRGVYIGPYYSYNFFERKDSWLVKSTNGGDAVTADSKTTLKINSLGFEMGYQFVFWDRVSLDMVLFGPGVAHYNLKMNLGSNLSEEDRQKLIDNLNAALAEKFPGYEYVIDDGEFETTGTSSTTKVGFRYMIQVGFRF